MVSPIPLVSFLITLLLASAGSIHGVPILDTQGNPVKVNELYIIRPAKGSGGLFPRDSGSNMPFSIGIFQINVNYPGDRVRFAIAPTNPPKPNLDTDSVVIIEFNTCERCKDSNYWGFDDSSASKEPPMFVGADPERVNSWFQIREHGTKVYLLTAKSGGQTVGILPKPHPNDVGRQLVVTDDSTKTFLVQFEKYNPPHATMAQTMFPFY